MIEESKTERITINNGTVEIKSKLYITIYDLPHRKYWMPGEWRLYNEIFYGLSLKNEREEVGGTF